MDPSILRKARRRVPSRFELSVIAAERCKQLMEGATPLVPCEEGDPPTKIALMEIAEGKVWKVEGEGKSYVIAKEEKQAQGEEGEQANWNGITSCLRMRDNFTGNRPGDKDPKTCSLGAVSPPLTPSALTLRDRIAADAESAL